MIDDVLAAKDWRCSASFSLHTQQRRSWPPVAMMDEPSAMQLIGAGEATHSCWRAAIFLVLGSPLDAWAAWTGVATTAWPLQRNSTPDEHDARLARRKNNFEIPVCLCMHRSSPGFACLNLPAVRCARAIFQVFLSPRQPPARSRTRVADLSPPQPRNGRPGRRLGAKVAADAPARPRQRGGTKSYTIVCGRRRYPRGEVDGVLGILQTALEKYGASNIAYVKAATQDEREDTVSGGALPIKSSIVRQALSYCLLCRVHAGFPRRLGGHVWTVVGQSRVSSGRPHAQNRKFVLIDGVGFPAVGSICGTSNADNSRRLRGARVVLVVKAGVGATIDETNYGTAFFGSRDVPVLGCF